MDDVSGSMPPSASEGIKSKEDINRIIMESLGSMSVDIQNNFLWPDHASLSDDCDTICDSFSMLDTLREPLDPVVCAGFLFEKLESAQKWARIAEMKFKNHLIEYRLSRKKVVQEYKKGMIKSPVPRKGFL